MATPKQPAGFKYSKKPTKLLREFARIPCVGRQYRVILVEVDGKPYLALRLYNGRGHFIKQFLMEPLVASAVGFHLMNIPLKG